MVYLQQFFVFSFSSPAFYCFCVALLLSKTDSTPFFGKNVCHIKRVFL